MRRLEAVWGALLEDPVCGRPEGHNPPCRSAQSVQRARTGDLARQRRRYQERVNVWLRVAPSLKARLAAYAGEQGLPMTAVLALLLDEALRDAEGIRRAA